MRESVSSIKKRTARNINPYNNTVNHKKNEEERYYLQLADEMLGYKQPSLTAN
jgi:hypothetical protein